MYKHNSGNKTESQKTVTNSQRRKDLAHRGIWGVEGDSGGKFSILGDDNIGCCEKKSKYECVSNSEWLLRHSCLNFQT